MQEILSLMSVAGVHGRKMCFILRSFLIWLEGDLHQVI
jgi:hypothetical protein